MRTRTGKRAVLVLARGGLLATVAVLVQAGGWLARLESVLYDERVRLCQGDQPPPAGLVHLDIDDASLGESEVGHWPWPRVRLARVIDEVARAGPALVEADLLLTERAEADGVLADALRRLGCGLLPRSLNFDAPPADPPRRRRLRRLLTDDPERTEAACVALLRSGGGGDRDGTAAADADGHAAAHGPAGPAGDPAHGPAANLIGRTAAGGAAAGGADDGADLDADLDADIAADVAADVAAAFSAVRQAAMRDRVWRELVAAGGPGPDPAAFGEALKARLLPHEDPLLTGTVLGRLFDGEYAGQCLHRWAVERFTLPPSVAGRTPLLAAPRELAPVPVLGGAAACSGFADYLPESVEGTARTVPLLARFADRVVPSMDLVAACRAIGADVARVRLTDDALTIPVSGRADVVVPVSVRDSPVVGRVGALMEVPLFGRPRDWQTMYDVPRHERPALHVSADAVWQACQTVDRQAVNDASIDRSLRTALSQADPQGLAEYAAAPPAGPALRRKVADVVDVLRSFTADGPPAGADATPDALRLYDNARRLAAVLPVLAAQQDELAAQLATQRAALRAAFHGRYVFLGTTATGLDQRPTSLFGATPGVVIHGAVLNAIVTGRLWRRADPATGVWLTAAAALATLLLTLTLPPGPAFVASADLAVGYLALNGFVLFARHGLIVEAAGPAVAVAVVWAGMTLADYLTEVADRARITRHFRAYVDPVVVDYVVAHPDHVRFDGERRELTVGFSDLAGFTTLTDQIGERVVPLLAEYVGRMIPVIRSRRGTFDKQIGDGLCFFFGAPEPAPDHAARAVATALAMHAALAEFNATLVARGHAPLGMRIGLATGEVVVGDAGAADAASYTTLGGTTNLAARLESANKAFGTRTLVSARTVELLAGAFVCRPVANLRVAGKLSCTMVYEPLAAAAEATDADRHLCAATAAVVDAYRAGDFPACAAAVAAMEAAYGPGPLTRLYAGRAARPFDPRDHCDGQVVLGEK